MTDFDESLYLTDTPLDTLCRKVGALARKGYDIRLTTYDAARHVVRAVVGDERARRKVLALVPNAEVEVL